MLKTFIGGISVGIANIIPGVSGGTMLVVLGLFNRLTKAISNLFKKDNPERKDDIIFLLLLLCGAGIGLVGFSKILTFLFNDYPTETMYWFVGMVAFSIPVFYKGQLDNKKPNILCFAIGFALIMLINLMTPADVSLNPDVPAFTISIGLTMLVIGFIAGFAMILPGVSGSMILLIIGQYHLFKKLISSITTFELNVFIFLGCVGVGILVGIGLAAIISKIALEKAKHVFNSFLLGLIVASTIILIPVNANYNLVIILTSIAAFIFGAFIIKMLEKI